MRWTCTSGPGRSQTLRRRSCTLHGSSSKLVAGRRRSCIYSPRCPSTARSALCTAFARARRSSRRPRGWAAAVPDEKVEHLTQAQKDQLESELAELEGPRRQEVVKAIA